MISVLVLLFFVTSIRCALAQDTDCGFVYTEQPPHHLNCDPYDVNELRLECTAYGPVDSEFGIAWFRRDTDVSSEAVLVRSEENGSSIHFQTREYGTKSIIRSQLRIQLPRRDAVSAFWCTLTPADGSSVTLQLLPSHAFILRAAESYQNLPSCGLAPQSSQRVKCAVPASAVAQPATPPFAHPAPQSSATPTPKHPATQTTLPITATEHTSQHRSITLQSSSSTWQLFPPPSQLTRPTMTVLAVPPPLTEGTADLSTIIFPVLACMAGAFGMLCIVTCVYLQCYYRRKKNKAVQKQFVEAAQHTYSDTVTSSYQHKRANQSPHLFSSASSLTPSLPLCRGARLGGSQNTSAWSDQYVEMVAASLNWARSQRSVASHSSWPTLSISGLYTPMADFKQGRSYEVPVTAGLEPAIPSPHIPHMVPNCRNVGTRLHQPSHSYDGTQEPHDHTCRQPPSLQSHDYEEIIYTTANTAYLQTLVPSDQDTHPQHPPVPVPSQTEL